MSKCLNVAHMQQEKKISKTPAKFNFICFICMSLRILHIIIYVSS